MGDNASNASARTKRSSQAGSRRSGSRRSGMAGSQGGASTMLTTSKINRFDEVSKKAVPNLFNAEVMRALGSRGGAVWERGIKDSYEAAGGGGQIGWSEAAQNTVAASDDINFYNKKFGLADCKLKISKTLLNKITEAIEKLVTPDKDGVRVVTETVFLQSVESAGLHLTKEQRQCMFKSIDKDGSGQIDFDEWMAAISGAA